MLFKKTSRRHFLQGSAGFLLSLPLLPSVTPKAYAANSSTRFFVSILKNHGGLAVGNMYPSEKLQQNQVLYPGQGSEMYGKEVISTFTGGGQNFSNVIGSYFSSSLLNKTNILQGIDLTVSFSHHGAQLGNFRRIDDSAQVNNWQFSSLQSIDQVMANSSSFYPSGDPRTAPTMNIKGGYYAGASRCASWYNNGGSILETPTPGNGGVQALFNYVFGSGSGGSSSSSSGGANPDIARKAQLVDKVLEDYHRLMSSSSLSSEDRLRVQQYIDELDQLETRLNNLIEPASCEAPGSVPNISVVNYTNLETDSTYWSIYFDVILAAFRCGKSRIATMWFGDPSGAYHNDVAHRHDSEQDTVRSEMQNALQYYYVPLLERLDGETVGLADSDATFLDQSAVLFQQEHGPDDHNCMSLPTLIAGSAGGYFQTGYYLDYRNYSIWRQPGLRQNRLLYTLLEAMGVSRSEYAVGSLANMYGYGDSAVNSVYGNVDFYPAYSWAACNQPLPGIVNI